MSKVLQNAHSAILSTFIKRPFVFKIFVLSILVAAYDRFYCIPYIKEQYIDVSVLDIDTPIYTCMHSFLVELYGLSLA